jgi:hypothetical protein
MWSCCTGRQQQGSPKYLRLTCAELVSTFLCGLGSSESPKRISMSLSCMVSISKGCFSNRKGWVSPLGALAPLQFQGSHFAQSQVEASIQLGPVSEHCPKFIAYTHSSRPGQSSNSPIFCRMIYFKHLYIQQHTQALTKDFISVVM